jgi:predicted Zn finger-like uncharacterized protein
MPDPLLTQCPHCETTFRITHEHLQIAGGAVRCGACYQVFHAGEHIVQTSEDAENPSPAPAATRPASTISAEDDFELEDFEDSFELDEPLRPSGVVAGAGSHTSGSRAGLSVSRPVDPRDDFDHSDLDGLDDFANDSLDQDEPVTRKSGKDSEDWARALLMELGEPLEDDEEDAPPPKSNRAGRPTAPASSPPPPRFEDDLSESFRSVGTQDIRDPFRMDGSAKEDEQPHDPEGWAKAMLKDDKAAFTTRTPPQVQPAPQKMKPEALEDGFLDGFDITDIDDAIDTPAQRSRGIEDIDLGDAASAMRTLELIPDEPRHKTPQGIIPPPLKAARTVAPGSTVQRPRSEVPPPVDPPSRRPLWAAGIVVVLIALGAALGIINFHQWSREPALRPVYQLACNAIGCQLPEQSDTSRIHANKLVVRTHPTIPNALSVDTLMINEASYTQPFPLLELTFEDINGNLVARNTFRPEEYIRDPGIDLRKMPPRTPFHVGLELRDPGRGAANYHLRFLPATQAAQ